MPGSPGTRRADELPAWLKGRLMTEQKLETDIGCPGMPGSGQAVDLMTERKLKMFAGQRAVPGFSGTRLSGMPGRLVIAMPGFSGTRLLGMPGKLAAVMPGFSGTRLFEELTADPGCRLVAGQGV